MNGNAPLLTVTNGFNGTSAFGTGSHFINHDSLFHHGGANTLKLLNEVNKYIDIYDVKDHSENLRKVSALKH
jgi:hypothetical protein